MRYNHVAQNSGPTKLHIFRLLSTNRGWGPLPKGAGHPRPTWTGVPSALCFLMVAFIFGLFLGPKARPPFWGVPNMDQTKRAKRQQQQTPHGPAPSAPAPPARVPPASVAGRGLAVAGGRPGNCAPSARTDAATREAACSTPSPSAARGGKDGKAPFSPGQGLPRPHSFFFDLAFVRLMILGVFPSSLGSGINVPALQKRADPCYGFVARVPRLGVPGA